MSLKNSINTIYDFMKEDGTLEKMNKEILQLVDIVDDEEKLNTNIKKVNPKFDEEQLKKEKNQNPNDHFDEKVLKLIKKEIREWMDENAEILIKSALQNIIKNKK